MITADDNLLLFWPPRSFDTFDSGSSTQYFHYCPVRAGCGYCEGSQALGQTQYDWSFVDLAICICLKNRSDRLEESANEFHRVGLCRRIIYYRPVAPTINMLNKTQYGCWESHRMTAQVARLFSQAKHCLVFEDDVHFLGSTTPKNVKRLRNALEFLEQKDADWDTVHIGHTPLVLLPYVPYWGALWKGKTLCAHAYFQSRRWMNFVASNGFLQWTWRHPSALSMPEIDHLMLNYGKQLCFSPILAVQSTSISSQQRPSFARKLVLWGLKLHSKYPHAHEAVAILWFWLLVLAAVGYIAYVLCERKRGTAANTFVKPTALHCNHSSP